MFFLLAACSSSDPLDYGTTLEPMELSTAPEPARAGELSLVSGHDDERDLYWAHGRAMLEADIEEVRAAFEVLDVVADRREVNTYSSSPLEHPLADVAFLVHNEVNSVITVEYDVQWLQAGSDSGDHVVVRWEKIAGTNFIDLLAGSVLLTRTEEGTALAFVEHLRAPTRDEATLEQYLSDLYGDLRAQVAGVPLPAL